MIINRGLLIRGRHYCPHGFEHALATAYTARFPKEVEQIPLKWDTPWWIPMAGDPMNWA